MGDVVFTKEMAKDYTILVPMMCPIHFELIKNVLVNSQYKVELLTNASQSVIDTGLKYVHNDTCYPALLVIGQMIDALQSGQYDLNKVALIITQTGGGCRASNYIYLLKKALKKAKLEYIPVISLNFSGLESQPGFKLTPKILIRLLAAVIYGDLLMDLNNQVKPYEINIGESNTLLHDWIIELSRQFNENKGLTKKQMKNNMNNIVQSFEKIKKSNKKCVKVGVVGEIYVKYSPLGNNSLEDFLYEQGCEVKVPGLMGFIFYCLVNNINDIDYYGGSQIKKKILEVIYHYFLGYEKIMIESIKKYSSLLAPQPFYKTVGNAKRVIDLSTKMGEGWLLTGEMLELCEEGYKNIICTQPFGCLPNHIVGKGMVRRIQKEEPKANIVAIDYDPGASQVNQENRIKLMLSIAREEL